MRGPEGVWGSPERLRDEPQKKHEHIPPHPPLHCTGKGFWHHVVTNQQIMLLERDTDNKYVFISCRLLLRPEHGTDNTHLFYWYNCTHGRCSIAGELSNFG